jgi:hypothetical protein
MAPEYSEFLSWFPCFKERNIKTVDHVIEFARSPAVTNGTMAACRFVLAVWNPTADHYGIGKFTLSDVASWDDRYLEAFQRWAADPFWY